MLVKQWFILFVILLVLLFFLNDVQMGQESKIILFISSYLRFSRIRSLSITAISFSLILSSSSRCPVWPLEVPFPLPPDAVKWPIRIPMTKPTIRQRMPSRINGRRFVAEVILVQEAHNKYYRAKCSSEFRRNTTVYCFQQR